MSVFVQMGFQIIYAFLWIYCNFFIHSEITLFGGQNLGQMGHLLRELLEQLPICQIYSCLTVILEYNWIFCKIDFFFLILEILGKVEIYREFHNKFVKTNKPGKGFSLHFYYFYTFTVWLNRYYLLWSQNYWTNYLVSIDPSNMFFISWNTKNVFAPFHPVASRFVRFYGNSLNNLQIRVGDRYLA